MTLVSGTSTSSKRKFPKPKRASGTAAISEEDNGELRDDESNNENEEAVVGEADNDPKSWHNTFQQKVQTRSPFFSMW